MKMCFFTMIQCLLCEQSVRPQLCFGEEKLESDSSVRLYSEIDCGYWFCDAKRGTFSKVVFREGETCGDQMCERTNCRVKIVRSGSLRCCFSHLPDCFKYRRSFEKKLSDYSFAEHSYFTPVLSAQQVLRLLLKHVTAPCNSVCKYDNVLVFFDSTYSARFTCFVDEGGVCKYRVVVERVTGEASPQRYVGVLSKFLNLRRLWTRRMQREGFNDPECI